MIEWGIVLLGQDCIACEKNLSSTGELLVTPVLLLGVVEILDPVMRGCTTVLEDEEMCVASH